MSGEATLVGTLTQPEGDRPVPAVLLVSGSGPQNRDEEIFGHKPFLVLADYLTRGGIAVLRVDDRGVGKSTGGELPATTATFVSDALAGVAFLKAQPGIDPKRIGIIGHSEGGLVAPQAAARSADVAFIVLLAAPGVNGDELLVRQAEMMYRVSGADYDLSNKALTEQRAALRLAKPTKTGLDTLTLRKQVRRMVEAQLAVNPSHAALTDEQENALVDQGYAQLTSPWMSYFITYNPRPALSSVRVPVLVLAGGHDTQVDADMNMPEIRKALKAGHNTQVTTHIFLELNHLFQTSKTGLVDEYATIEETMNPEVLKTIRDWILALGTQ